MKSGNRLCFGCLQQGNKNKDQFMNTMEMIRGLILCRPDASSQRGPEPDFGGLCQTGREYQGQRMYEKTLIIRAGCVWKNRAVKNFCQTHCVWGI